MIQSYYNIMTILITEIDMPFTTYYCIIILHCTLVAAAALTIATAIVSVTPLPFSLLFILLTKIAFCNFHN